MADDVHIRKMNCPSCGAPIELGGTSGTCDYCGARLERAEPKAEPAQPIPTTFSVQVPQVQVVQWPAAHTRSIQLIPAEEDEPTGCVGGVFGVIMLLGVIGALLAGGWFFGDSALAAFNSLATSVPGLPEVEIPAFGTPDRSNSWTINGPALLLPESATNPTASDAIVTAYHPYESHYALLYLEGSDHQQRWQSEPLADGYSAIITLGGSHLYVANNTDLLAIDLAEGTTVWQAALADKIISCQDCVQAIGDNVVVLTQDGTLQAFNALTGQPQWNTLLNKQPRQLLAVNGYAAVLDQETDTAESDLFLYNVTDGTLAQRLSPRCPNHSFANSPQGPNLYDPVHVADGGQTIYFIGGFFEPGCLQRWDAASGTMTWEATFPVDRIRDQRDDLLTATTYYLSSGHNLTAVNLADGTVRELLSESDYNLAPLGEQGGLLLVSATRQRGTQRDELWAIDANSGQRLWQFVPQATTRLSDSSVHSGNGLWTWQFTGQGVVVLQARPEPNRLIVETLQRQDGVSTGQTTVELNSSSFSLDMEVIGWQGDQVWLKLDNKLMVLDTTEAAFVSNWP
jgi:outer membrane protein assembly factor BamB